MNIVIVAINLFFVVSSGKNVFSGRASRNDYLIVAFSGSILGLQTGLYVKGLF